MRIHRCMPLLAAVALLSLSGCNVAVDTGSLTSSGDTAASATQAANHRSGLVETASGRYAFTPKVCAIHYEDGVPDIEIGGAGKAPDGEKIYVQFSSTADQLTIDLGVDSAFATAERRLRADDFVSGMEISGKTIRVANLALVGEQGSRQPASLKIDC